jgi:DNA replication protein
MIEFNGFPARTQFTPIPNIVFSSLFPQITEINELKILFHIFEIIYPKKGIVRFVSFNELLSRASWMTDLKDSHQETLRQALESLTKKGAILQLSTVKDEASRDLYLLNTEANRRAVEKIQKGEMVLPNLKPEVPTPVIAPEPSDIFTLYEQNIGMLTPLIADELRETSKQYPATWIKEAIKEAVKANKRNWKYIARILEHWSTEGKDDGTYRGNIKKNADPDKYIRGKYGHMVQR